MEILTTKETKEENKELDTNITQTDMHERKDPIAQFIVYADNHPEVIIEALMKRGNFIEVPVPPVEEQENAFANLQFIWRPVQFQRVISKKIEQINATRQFASPLVYNHIDSLKLITSKTGLVKTLSKFYLTCPSAIENKYTLFDSVPNSYIIEAQVEDEEYFQFILRYKEIADGVHFRGSMPEKHCEKNLWLIKPANMNQGRGIEVVSTMKEIKKFLGSKLPHSKWVIQKYIERPLLYLNRKFDIRVWVLVTDRADVFLYKDGYIRTSSEEFNIHSSLNYVHLTNNCLQKFGTNYGKFEEGNTIGYDVLQSYITEKYPDLKVDIQEHIIPRMKDLILDSILAVKDKISVPIKKRLCNFELLGYDFMIDEDFRVWLIEINTNPYLGIPNPFIRGILPNMVDNMLSLVLDPIYPSREKKDTKNNFELIHCEKESLYSPTPINIRRNYKKELIYPIKKLVSPTIEEKSFAFEEKRRNKLKKILASKAKSHAPCEKKATEGKPFISSVEPF